MQIKEIFDLEPQISEVMFGAEPSLRTLIEKYYAPHFPEDYKQMAQEYLDELLNMVQSSDKAKWWYFDQNNSGGYYYRNGDVLECVFIQAESAEKAEEKAEDIFSDYIDYCECCGERWYINCNATGDDEPKLYGEALSSTKPIWSREQAVLYYNDGSRRYYKFGKGFCELSELDTE